jgi:DNA polymerase-3 subunit gamma/tau
MSLYNKYRPNTFSEIYGNTASVKSLQKLIEREKQDIPHAFLFVGPSGCGKTTMARILKDELQCKGRDYQEYNAAHFRGIDAIRQIISNVNLKPMQGDSRAILLDEAHQITKDAQNVLLKALEEPPSHMYFMLATTDPLQLIDTVRNRCMVVDVSFLDDEDTKNLIKRVGRKERYRVPQALLDVIARDSLGSPRAALSMLESVIGLDEDEAIEMAQQVAEKENNVIDLCRALVKGSDWKTIASLVTNLKDDPESSRRAILTYMSKVLANSRTKPEQQRAYLIMDAFSPSVFYLGKAGLMKQAYEALFSDI